MSFSGKKPFGWHANNNGSHASDGPRSNSRSSRTFSAQSRRFFGFAPLPEEQVLTSLKARLENSKPSSPAPKARIQRKRLLPSVASPHSDSRLNTNSLSTSSSKSRLSPSRAFPSSFSPYSSPTRCHGNSSLLHSSKSMKSNEYLGGISDLVQLKSHSDVLSDSAFPAVFPDLHRMMTSSTTLRDGRSESKFSTHGQQIYVDQDAGFILSDSRNSRRIRFDDNVQRIVSDYRPPSSSNCTDQSTVYIIEDIDSSESSEKYDSDDNFDYDPERERSVLACRLGVLPDHGDLLWIVDECIMESSKDPWQLCFSKNSIIYHNRRTGEV
jgi:hypothetical protein